MRKTENTHRARCAQQAAIILATAAIAGAASMALAADKTWDGGGADANWSTGANWENPGNAAPLNNDNLRFDGNLNTAAVNDYAADFSFSRLEFFETAGAFSITGNRITMNGNIVSGASSGSTSTAVHSIGTDLILNGARIFQSNGSTGLIVGGKITETGGSRPLTKSGTGSLTLSADNTFSGGLTASGGHLNINHAGAVGTGTLTFSATSSFDNTSAVAITLANNNAISLGTGTGAQVHTFVGTRNLNLGTGAVMMGGNRTVAVNAGVLTLGGGISQITGSRSLTKTGAGTLVLAGTNLYSGGTWVDAGTLQLSGSVVGATTIRNGAQLQLSGAVDTGLSVGVGGGSPSSGHLELLGGASLGSASIALQGGSFINNTGVTRTFSNPLTVIGTAFGGANDLVFTDTAWAVNARAVTVNDNATTLAGKFNASGGATFSLSGTGKLIWLGTNAANGNPSAVNSGATLQIGNGGTLGDIGGNSIANAGTLIFNRSDDYTYALNISGAGTFIKDGPNTLTFAAAKTYTGATEIAAGTLRLTSAGSVASTSSYTVAPGAALDVSAKATYSLAAAPTTIGLSAIDSGFIDGGTTTALTLGSTLTLDFATASLVDGHQYDLFDMLSQTGDFTNVLLSGSFAGTLSHPGIDTWTGTFDGWTFDFTESTGVLTITAVPEPAMVGSLALIACVALRGRRQQGRARRDARSRRPSQKTRHLLVGRSISTGGGTRRGRRPSARCFAGDSDASDRQSDSARNCPG